MPHSASQHWMGKRASPAAWLPRLSSSLLSLLLFSLLLPRAVAPQLERRLPRVLSQAAKVHRPVLCDELLRSAERERAPGSRDAHMVGTACQVQGEKLAGKRGKWIGWPSRWGLLGALHRMGVWEEPSRCRLQLVHRPGKVSR